MVSSYYFHCKSIRADHSAFA